MQILVHTDKNVSGREGHADRLAATVEERLARFSYFLTRVEIHLADDSSGRATGGDHHRCTIEARPTGHQPVAVTAHAPTADESVASAIGKLTTVLAREHDRRQHHQGSASIRTDDSEQAAGNTEDVAVLPPTERNPAEG